MGGGSTASAIENLSELRYNTILRLGTCGAIQDFIEDGDFIISTGTV